jgi:hypothetical protein
MVLPEYEAMRELRRELARGGLPPVHARTPADMARIASFRALEELMRFLSEYRRRIDAGERCRIVEHESPRVAGRLDLHLMIEVDP